MYTSHSIDGWWLNVIRAVLISGCVQNISNTNNTLFDGLTICSILFAWVFNLCSSSLPCTIAWSFIFLLVTPLLVLWVHVIFTHFTLWSFSFTHISSISGHLTLHHCLGPVILPWVALFSSYFHYFHAYFTLHRSLSWSYFLGSVPCAGHFHFLIAWVHRIFTHFHTFHTSLGYLSFCWTSNSCSTGYLFMLSISHRWYHFVS